MTYSFLVETYETERIKVVSVWSMFKDEDLGFRPNKVDRRGRSVHEHMVHQCVSEDLWFRTMLGIDVGAPPRGWVGRGRRGGHRARVRAAAPAVDDL